MKKLFYISIILLITIGSLKAQMPFQVQLVVNNDANTLAVQLRNVENNQPTTAQIISSINMRLLGSVSDIISIASTNYTMLMPSTTLPNTQVITMSSTGLQSPENWTINNWVTVVVYNLNPGNYTLSSFSIQGDLDGDNSDVQDPIMSVAASGVFNIPLFIQSTILPIELISFEVSKLNKNEALLTWLSEKEIGFDRFEIERSSSLKDFEVIGTIEGSNQRNYQFIDKNPLLGNNYYRLKMIDIDGKYKYSELRNLVFENSINLKIRPNPSTSGDISFVLNGLKNPNDINLIVTNISGELVKSINYQNVNHTTECHAEISKTSGIYLVRITTSEGQSFVEKIVVEN